MNPNGSITLAQAVLLAILQGVTELFPVSSLGHAVVVPHLIGWNLDQQAPAYLPFLVMLHLGTALALLAYFWPDWWALLSSLASREPTPLVRQNRYLLWLLVVGTVPAGILGLLLEKRLALLFGRYQMVGLFLVLNGLLLLGAEWLRRQERFGELSKLRPRQALLIGLSQAIALLPGFSRSGAAMAGGLLVGLTHQSAARFGFLLSTPIILAAAVLEVPKLFAPALRPELAPALAGGVTAGVVAYLSTAILMRYFRSHEVNALLPFAFYCVVLGGAALVMG